LAAKREADAKEAAELTAKQPPPPPVDQSADVDVVGNGASSSRTRQRFNGSSTTAKRKPVVKASKSKDWELDCEICGKRGVNLVRAWLPSF
jgi:hypothetical protein